MRAAFLASLALVLLFTAPARAGRSGSNDVGVVVVGEATMQPQLAAQLESWLRQHGHSLVPAPLPPDAINTMTANETQCPGRHNNGIHRPRLSDVQKLLQYNR